MGRNKTVYRIMIDNETGASAIEEDELLTELIDQIEGLNQDVRYLVEFIQNKFETQFIKF